MDAGETCFVVCQHFASETSKHAKLTGGEPHPFFECQPFKHLFFRCQPACSLRVKLANCQAYEVCPTELSRIPVICHLLFAIPNLYSSLLACYLPFAIPNFFSPRRKLCPLRSLQFTSFTRKLPSSTKLSQTCQGERSSPNDSFLVAKAKLSQSIHSMDADQEDHIRV